eukprot:2351964-Lingulodinium_polyedra.AAC.1
MPSLRFQWRATRSTTAPPINTERNAPAASAPTAPELRKRLAAYSSTPPPKRANPCLRAATSLHSLARHASRSARTASHPQKNKTDSTPAGRRGSGGTPPKRRRTCAARGRRTPPRPACPAVQRRRPPAPRPPPRATTRRPPSGF